MNKQVLLIERHHVVDVLVGELVEVEVADLLGVLLLDKRVPHLPQGDWAAFIELFDPEAVILNVECRTSFVFGLSEEYSLFYLFIDHLLLISAIQNCTRN